MVFVIEFLRLEDICKSLFVGSYKRLNCVVKIVVKKKVICEFLCFIEVGIENLSEEELEKVIVELKS